MTWTTRGWMVVVAVLAVALGWSRWDAARMRRVAAANGFRADSEAAAADTGRRRWLDSVDVLGARLAEAERRATQPSRPQTEPVAGTLMAGGTTATGTTHVATTAQNEGARVDTFAWRTPPFTVRAHVWVRPVPGPDSARVWVTLDAAQLRVTVRCAAHADASGVRAATWAVTGPGWLDVRPGPAEVDREVCNAGMARPTSKARRRWPWVVVGAVAGAVTAYGEQGRVTDGALVGGAVGLGLALAMP